MAKVVLTPEEAAQILVNHLVMTRKLENKVTNVSWGVDRFTPTIHNIVFEQDEEK